MYVSVAPGAASVAETDLTTSGSTFSRLTTVLLLVGVGVSVETTLAVLGIEYGVAEIGRFVLALTANATVALAPGTSVPTFHVTIPPAAPHDDPPAQLA